MSSRKSSTNIMTDYCFQSYFTQNTQPSQSQELLTHIVTNTHGESNQTNSSKLRFKIESVGVHPENDDDLHMCPARVRPSWPKKIIPWWVASSPNEKPPYSYATLIAHAILSSKDGRLTLNDIYTWIADSYPAFSIGNGGWQNSIRHNLSLNKKWFCKIDRRPTQTNPGKGCYWTLVAGTEQIFIDNLTQEGGHSRKHHDIGLTAELSIRQRRGACYYHNAPTTTVVTPDCNQPLQQNSTFDTSALATPPPTPTKPRTLIPPLYTTFKMVDMSEKSQQQRLENNEAHDDSDNDSGVDVNIKFVDIKHLRKRRRTTTTHDGSKEKMVSGPAVCSPPSMQDFQHVNASMVNDTPTSTPISSFDLAPTPATFDVHDWVENSLVHSKNQSYTINQHEFQWPTTIENNLWCDSIIVPPPSSTSSAISTSSYHNKKRSPITINLDDEEITHKYLHFEEDDEDTHSHSSIPHSMSTTMPLNLHNRYHNLYPHTDPLSFHSNATKANYIPPSLPNTTLLYNNQLLQQFVTMQDILYS